MYKDRLPPLVPLIAFEAAARQLSFTLAGRELNLTQAAISQQIRLLEQRLGVDLFTREHRAVRLTRAGREYQHTVSTVLKHLASATSDVRTDVPSRLNIATDQSIAHLWLVPRLAEFARNNPGIQLRLVVSDDEAECLAGDISAAILHGDGSWPGFDSAMLFGEEVFPVCSPQYLADRGSKLANVKELVNETLLDLEDSHWDWMNWRYWLNENGIEQTALKRRLQINHYPLLIDAASNGQGIALGWKHLVDQALQDGQLVRPVEVSVKTKFGYHLVCRSNQTESDAVEIFCDWVISEFN